MLQRNFGSFLDKYIIREVFAMQITNHLLFKKKSIDAVL